MRIGWLGAAIVVAALLIGEPAIAFAQDMTKAVDKESTGIFTSILRILIRWIFPLGAAYCFLYGIVGKGVKRGEWDMAAIAFVVIQLVSHAASLPFQSAMPRPAGGNAASAAGQAASALAA